MQDYLSGSFLLVLTHRSEPYLVCLSNIGTNPLTSYRPSLEVPVLLKNFLRITDYLLSKPYNNNLYITKCSPDWLPLPNPRPSPRRLLVEPCFRSDTCPRKLLLAARVELCLTQMLEPLLLLLPFLPLSPSEYVPLYERVSLKAQANTSTGWPRLPRQGLWCQCQRLW